MNCATNLSEAEVLEIKAKAEHVVCANFYLYELSISYIPLITQH